MITCYKRLVFAGTLNKLVKKLFSQTKAQKRPLAEQFTELMGKKSEKQIPQTTGLAWKIQYLKAKSNQDLHKLWYVCLKEKNLLLADFAVKSKLSTQAIKMDPRMGKVKQTMSRILTVMGERQRVREQYRKKLQQEYIEKKKQQLIKQTSKLNDPDIPEISQRLLKQKYRDLRKGIDNVQYLERQNKRLKQMQQKKQKLNDKFRTPIPQFTSFFEKELELGEGRPSQEEVLRSHIKNWRMLNLKQRRIILGFLNARRAKDAKTHFLKELKLLGQKIAHDESKQRIKNENKQ